MRLLSSVLACAAAGAVALPLAAQTREAPNLIFTISGGLTSGSELWDLPKQVYPVPPSAADSFALGRRLRPGLVATVGASYFTGPHLGWSFEVGYFGIETESRCTPLGPYSPSADQETQQACTRIQGEHQPSSVVGFQAGAVYRFSPSQPFSPYLRATGGFGILGNSFIQTEAVVNSSACATGPSCLFALLQEEKRQDFTALGTLAAGFTVQTGSAYRLRLEIRDLIANLPTVEGAVAGTDPTFPAAITGTRLKHIVMLTLGVDVVLERRRGRRY